MNKVLGIDLGTNSLGWAIVEQSDDNNKNKLFDKGVYIFSEGVKLDKGAESSKASERTDFRLARRQKFRRKLRKYRTLKVLIENKMCPLTNEDLDKWVKYKKGIKKEYPKSKTFLEWLKTDEENGINPYFFRANAVKHKITLLEVGRAIYHIAQRRGYKSNRLESTKESDGLVNTDIEELQKEKDGKTLGEYFHELHKQGIKIRSRYTSREKDYISEFDKISMTQGFDEKLKKELYNAVFFQRPLKSQKGLVGHCTFEKSKPRCPISHTLFEEFRMLQFINSIKYYDDSGHLVFLTNEQKDQIRPLFARKSKPHFEFEDIRKKLSKKDEDKFFNYKDYTLISGCPVMVQMKEVLGDNWKKFKKEYTRERDGKISVITYETVWNVLFSFDDDEKIKEFGIKRLGFDEDKAEKLKNINFKQGYANLSLCAIRKILPYLEQGLLYTHAAYFANLDKVLKDKSNSIKEKIKTDIGNIIDAYNENKIIYSIANGYIGVIKEKPSFNISGGQIKEAIEKKFERDNYPLSESKKKELFEKLDGLVKNEINNKKEPAFIKIGRLDEEIKKHLKTVYDIPEPALDKLYHPSDIDIYPEVEPGKDGKKCLGSPRTPSVRNPMAMKALHQLRYVVNTLLKTGKISSGDMVNIELSRELNDANKRAAIKWFQHDLEKMRASYEKTIKDDMGKDYVPNENDILKYQLWEEQNHKCLYTGKQIKVTDFISDNPVFDIEHTIPLSLSCDDSQANKTLCDADFNRNIKQNKIPYDLPESYRDLIMQRIEPWKNKIDDLNNQIIRAGASSRNASSKEEKDKAIQRKNYLSLQRNYWQDKYDRFTMKKVPEGFSNRQFVDTTVITKYARAYLKTVFDRVYTVKGAMTAEFRKLWGLQKEFETKERISHTHHTIDSIVIACIKKGHNNLLSEYFKQSETERKYKPHFKKPWETFTEDVKKLEDEIIAKHYSKDNALKQSKKILRVRGKIKRFNDGDGDKSVRYMNGNSFRGSLHLQTVYGAVRMKDENGTDETFYVVRKPLNAESFKKIEDLEKIVDKTVRDKVTEIIKNRMNEGKSLKDAFAETIWMNQDKKIPINKVRCIDRVSNPIPLKRHKDLSKHEYKQNVYVANEENSVFGIYEGTNKGKTKRDFELLNNYDISKGMSLPDEKSGMKLIYKLKKGTMVFLYENSPEEIFKIKDDYKELSKRLYKFFKFIVNGQIFVIHHLEARSKRDLHQKNGIYSMNDEIFPIRMFYPSQLNALVENVDFIVTNDSKIEFRSKPE